MRSKHVIIQYKVKLRPAIVHSVRYLEAAATDSALEPWHPPNVHLPQVVLINSLLYEPMSLTFSR